MLKATLIFVCILQSSLALAFQTLDCASSNGISYFSHSRMSGVAPRPGDILNITELQKNAEVLSRKVTRHGCWDGDQCELQQPELENINPELANISFLPKTKTLLQREGSVIGPYYKEIYAIKAEIEDGVWMVCETTMALLP